MISILGEGSFEIREQMLNLASLKIMQPEKVYRSKSEVSVQFQK